MHSRPTSSSRAQPRDPDALDSTSLPTVPRRSLWIYVLASRSRALCIGVMNDLSRRLGEHRDGTGHATRDRARRLLYAEEFADARDATARERRLKGWRREKKVALVERQNPAWRDWSRGDLR